MPIRFIHEFQMTSNNSVFTNNTFYVTPSPSFNNNRSSSSLVITNHLPPTAEKAPKLNWLGQNQNNAIEIKTATAHVTEKLPRATASINKQQYETNFDADVLPLSVEESGKSARLVYKEKDVDVTQSYQKPTTIGNVQRACFVHLQEQYHLDNNLLSQSRATKYFVKVRTEINPGRYMAKLELHSSRSAYT